MLFSTRMQCARPSKLRVKSTWSNGSVAADAVYQVVLSNDRFGPEAAARHRRLRSEPLYSFMSHDERAFA